MCSSGHQGTFNPADFNFPKKHCGKQKGYRLVGLSLVNFFANEGIMQARYSLQTFKELLVIVEIFSSLSVILNNVLAFKRCKVFLRQNP